MPIGRCSEFGGPFDEEMKDDTGLSFYEPWEANLRPDLFVLAPKDEPNQQTWKRLKTYSIYIALPLPLDIPRIVAQNTPYKVMNPRTGEWIIAFVVDRGPAEDTGRIVDCSHGLLSLLGMKTDELISVDPLILK